MAQPHLSTTLEQFEATVQKTKNRLIAVPARVQRALQLDRRPNNHILLYSIRLKGEGRWQHLLSYLTRDNEFAVPAGVAHIKPGSQVEVKVHRVVADVDAGPSNINAGALLVELAGDDVADEREDGSTKVDEYLYGDDDA